MCIQQRRSWQEEEEEVMEKRAHTRKMSESILVIYGLLWQPPSSYTALLLPQEKERVTQSTSSRELDEVSPAFPGLPSFRAPFCSL